MNSKQCTEIESQKQTKPPKLVASSDRVGSILSPCCNAKTYDSYSLSGLTFCIRCGKCKKSIEF